MISAVGSKIFTLRPTSKRKADFDVHFCAKEIPNSQSDFYNPLMLSEKMNNLNFSWYDEKVYYRYLDSEIEELKVAAKNNDRANMKEELGDVLFDTVRLAHFYKINPSEALKETTNKLNERLSLAMALSQEPLSEYSMEEQLGFWNSAKKILRERESLDVEA